MGEKSKNMLDSARQSSTRLDWFGDHELAHSNPSEIHLVGAGADFFFLTTT